MKSDLETISEVPILEKIINDKVISFEKEWPLQLAISGNRGYYILREDSDDISKFTLEIYHSKQAHLSNEQPKVQKFDRILYTTKARVEPSHDVIRAIFGKKVKAVEFLDPDKSPEFVWMKPLMRDTINIRFVDEISFVIQLYALASMFKEWAIGKGFTVSCDTLKNYYATCIKNDAGEKISGDSLNAKEYASTFLAVEILYNQLEEIDIGK